MWGKAGLLINLPFYWAFCLNIHVSSVTTRPCDLATYRTHSLNTHTHAYKIKICMTELDFPFNVPFTLMEVLKTDHKNITCLLKYKTSLYCRQGKMTINYRKLLSPIHFSHTFSCFTVISSRQSSGMTRHSSIKAKVMADLFLTTKNQLCSLILIIFHILSKCSCKI